MEFQKIKNKTIHGKWLLTRLVAVFFICFLMVASAIFIFEGYYQGKIYPGVSVAGINMSGKTFEEVQTILKEKTDNILNQGLVYDYRGKTLKVDPVVVSTVDIDFSYEILHFDLAKMTKTIEQAGREHGWFDNTYEQGKIFFQGKIVPVQFELNEEELQTILADYFNLYERQPKNANVRVKEKTTIEVVPEKLGRVFDYENIIKETGNNVRKLDGQQMALKLVTRYPKVDKDEAEIFLPKVKAVIDNEPYTLIYGDKKWELGWEDFVEWFEFLEKDGTATFGLDQEEIMLYLESIAKEVEVEAQDAKFALEEGRVKEFQPSREGINLQLIETAQEVSTVLLASEKKDIELVVEIVSPNVATESINDLGIKEIIGVGESNFAWSPPNRRHNIANGADTLNGILIPPDEEFSIIQALGNIDGAHGYLPEMVIKGNRTVPEYGGGLCQIGTTMFRVALNTGLPITERRNHSYRVSYYEPAGTDATIYGPHPDVRFINDTDHHILVTTEVDGDNLAFTMWGTSDDREVVLDPYPPLIYNITSPGATRVIETPDLAPGQEKWLERSHKGADTKFTQIVTHSDGEIKEKVFESHYRAWPAMKLVGVAPVEESGEGEDGGVEGGSE